jgi:hypothetical protein
MIDEPRSFEERQEKLAELVRFLQQGEVPVVRRDKTEGSDDLPYLLVKGAQDKNYLLGMVHAQNGLEAPFDIDKACENSHSHVHIRIPGRKPLCFGDVSDAETIGTLTEKLAESLGVDKRNWGFYMAGPKMQREFLPNSARVREIMTNHAKNLHFLPRTAIK